MNNSLEPRPIADESAVDLKFGDIAVALWRSRRLILFFSIIGAAVGLGTALLAAKYESEGFFQFGGPVPVVNQELFTKEKKKTLQERQREIDDRELEGAPGIALADFKRFAASFGTVERFNEYVAERSLENAAGIAGVRKQFLSSGGIAGTIEPVYPFTKLDAKLLIDQPKGSSNNIIGLRIKYAADSPEEAQRMVALLGAYAMDTIMYRIYSDAILYKTDEIKTKLTFLDSRIIEQKMRLDQYQRTAQRLKLIAEQHSASSNQLARQVVEITEETARFLPPATLLTTARVQEAEASEEIEQAKLEQRQMEVLLRYYERVKSVLSDTRSGESVLRQLEGIKTEVFNGRDLNDEVIKAVYNRISFDNQNAINVYLSKSRFIAGPTFPQKSTARPVVSLAIGLALGLFFGGVLMFVRKWWESNQARLSKSC